MSKLALGTRSAATFIRALQFAIAALILGIFSYYLATLSRRSGQTSIPTWEKAVEGISGAAVIYTAFALILTCFLGGITFFAFLGVVLDICFCGGFIAIAVLARGGTKTCTGANNSPIGPGNHVSCQLQRVTFITAIIAAFLFLVSAALQILLSRAHKREKRYGPSPSNNYTSGSGKKRKPWQRKSKKTGMHDAELGAVGAGAVAGEKHHHHNNRSSMHPSDDTAVASNAPVADGYGGPTNKYAEPTVPTVHNNDAYTRSNAGYGSSTNYEPQSTGVTGLNHGHVQEMAPGHHGSAANANVVHDTNPYADVHQGGFVHQNPESSAYARNV